VDGGGMQAVGHGQRVRLRILLAFLRLHQYS
jgi:hypothetical protein